MRPLEEMSSQNRHCPNRQGACPNCAGAGQTLCWELTPRRSLIGDRDLSATEDAAGRVERRHQERVERELHPLILHTKHIGARLKNRARTVEGQARARRQNELAQKSPTASLWSLPLP